MLARKIFNPLFTSCRNHQVTVLGGATDIGQAICLLLRAQPDITRLVVHDTQAQTPGVVLDLSHITTDASVVGFVGEDKLEHALLNSEIVIGAGGIIHKPGVSDKLRLSTNTAFIKSLAKGVARLRPMPFVGIITEPLNSLIPTAAEVIRNHGEYNPKKLFGITDIDALRAQSIFAAEHNLDPHSVFIPVIGGHSDKTCIPLLSQAQPYLNVTEVQARDFTTKLRNAEDNILTAKKGFGPVLSIAYSALLFTRSVLSVLEGKHATVNAFVENNDFGTEYFSGLVHINDSGVTEMWRYSNLSNYECELLENSIHHLRKDVSEGKRVLEYA